MTEGMSAGIPALEFVEVVKTYGHGRAEMCAVDGVSLRVAAYPTAAHRRLRCRVIGRH